MYHSPLLLGNLYLLNGYVALFIWVNRERLRSSLHNHCHP
jgi:hypothetical protein